MKLDPEYMAEEADVDDSKSARSCLLYFRSF